MIANLKGISLADVKAGSYIQMDLTTKKRDDDASSGKQSDVSYKSDGDEEDQSPLRRQKLKTKERLKTTISVPTSNLISNSEVI